MSENDLSGEALSALVDGEATDIDIARVLKAVDDPELRARWARQHAIGEALRGDAPKGLQIDVSAGVRAAIKERPSRRANPFTSLAVAASVTLAVVFGGQQLLSTQIQEPVGSLPGGVVALGGASAMQASFGGSQRGEVVSPRPVERVVLPAPSISSTAGYEQLAAEKYQRLMLQHAAASAALQPSSTVPYVRAPENRR
jgi:sigma-E factor negative regulatory protein RseA